MKADEPWVDHERGRILLVPPSPQRDAFPRASPTRSPQRSPRSTHPASGLDVPERHSGFGGQRNLFGTDTRVAFGGDGGDVQEGSSQPLGSSRPPLYVLSQSPQKNSFRVTRAPPSQSPPSSPTQGEEGVSGRNLFGGRGKSGNLFGGGGGGGGGGGALVDDEGPGIRSVGGAVGGRVGGGGLVGGGGDIFGGDVGSVGGISTVGGGTMSGGNLSPGRLFGGSGGSGGGSGGAGGGVTSGGNLSPGARSGNLFGEGSDGVGGGLASGRGNLSPGNLSRQSVGWRLSLSGRVSWRVLAERGSGARRSNEWAEKGRPQWIQATTARTTRRDS